METNGRVQKSYLVEGFVVLGVEEQVEDEAHLVGVLLVVHRELLVPREKAAVAVEVEEPLHNLGVLRTRHR